MIKKKIKALILVCLAVAALGGVMIAMQLRILNPEDDTKRLEEKAKAYTLSGMKPEDEKHFRSIMDHYFNQQIQNAGLNNRYHGINTQDDFMQWQDSLKGKAAELLAITPGEADQVSVPMHYGKRYSGAGILVIHTAIPSVTGVTLPGILFVPQDGQARHPGVIIYHGHGLGKLWAAFDPQSELKALAFLLAKEGFVTFTYDQIGFGEMEFMDHSLLIQKGLLLGKPVLGQMVMDGLIAAKLFSETPYVDPDRIGIAGHSLGGEIVLYVSLFDESIKSTACLSIFSSYEGAFFHSLQHVCQHLPGILKYFDMPDLASALAPRSLLIQLGNEDPVFNPVYSGPLLRQVKQAYALFEKQDAFIFQAHPGGHEIDPDQTIRFFKETLSKR